MKRMITYKFPSKHHMKKSLFVYNIIIWIMMIGMKNMKNVF